MRPDLVDPKLLQPNPWNTNRVGAENMTKLKRSITELGFTSVVVVRELPGGALQILGGQHRTEVAIELGLKQVPILNLGVVDDVKAKKIGLVDNSRYGTDDTISLARLLEDLGDESKSLATFMPFTDADFDIIRRSVDIDLDDLQMDMPEDDEEPEEHTERTEKPQKTHDMLRFRVALGDAERINKLIEQTIKREGFTDDDELTAAGSALALILLT